MTQKWKESWGSAIALADDLVRLRLRPDQTSLIVNTYIYHGGGEVAVIDPGWPATVDALVAALADIGVAGELAEVDYWLYTHAHIDHMGAAALIEGRIGPAKRRAPHIAAGNLKPQLTRWHAFQSEVHDWTPWIERAFREPHRTRIVEARANQPTLWDRYGPARLDGARLLEFGGRIDIGELSLQFVDARGHDMHHGAFFERDRGWLFSGDVVLVAPTPISRSMNDQLSAYRATLDRFDTLDIAFLLPGHGLHRRDGIDAAIARSREFVTDYNARTLAALRRADTPIDLYQLGLDTTPDGQPLQPSGRWWVHLALVDSHLQEHIAHRRAICIADKSGPRYAAR